MLGPLLAVLFAIPWKILHLHASSLEPFHKLSDQAGTTITKAMLRDYGGMSCVFGVVPLLTACLAYGTAILAPLTSEAWVIGLLSSCPEDAHGNCLPQMQAVPSVVRTMEALLALFVLLASTLVVVLWRWSTGVVADPRSLAGIASLAQSSDLRNLFASFLAGGVRTLSISDIKSQVGDIRVCLSGPGLSQSDYGITLLSRSKIGNPANPEKETVGVTSRFFTFAIKATLLILAFAAFIIGLGTLVIYYRVTSGETRYERFMSGQGFGPRFLFSACGVVISFGWAQVFSGESSLVSHPSRSSC